MHCSCLSLTLVTVLGLLLGLGVPFCCLPFLAPSFSCLPSLLIFSFSNQGSRSWGKNKMSPARSSESRYVLSRTLLALVVSTASLKTPSFTMKRSFSGLFTVPLALVSSGPGDTPPPPASGDASWYESRWMVGLCLGVSMGVVGVGGTESRSSSRSVAPSSRSCCAVISFRKSRNSPLFALCRAFPMDPILVSEPTLASEGIRDRLGSFVSWFSPKLPSLRREGWDLSFSNEGWDSSFCRTPKSMLGALRMPPPSSCWEPLPPPPASWWNKSCSGGVGARSAISKWTCLFSWWWWWDPGDTKDEGPGMTFVWDGREGRDLRRFPSSGTLIPEIWVTLPMRGASTFIPMSMETMEASTLPELISPSVKLPVAVDPGLPSTSRLSKSKLGSLPSPMLSCLANPLAFIVAAACVLVLVLVMSSSPVVVVFVVPVFASPLASSTLAFLCLCSSSSIPIHSTRRNTPLPP
mmetsp:Transcript_4297/g.12601  ORF Transcript_4297/g.12601 Transcript_4297/m.12601 type:complete len:465 (+) Transcript_4297:1917-3311(+)